MTAREVIAQKRDNTLAKHADEIRKLGKQTVENVIEIGRRLIECKKLVRHGNWLPWLEREFGWSDQTARNFMRTADLSKSKTVLNLDLPVKALYLLAAPSTPDEARDEIIKHAQRGEPVSVAETKRIIEDTKGRKQPAKKSKRAKAPDPSPPVSDEVLKRRAEAAERIRALMGKPRDDVPLDNSDEAARLQARVDELQAEKRRLEIKITGLESEIEEAKTARQIEQKPKAANDTVSLIAELSNAHPWMEEFIRQSVTEFAKEVVHAGPEAITKGTNGMVDCSGWVECARLVLAKFDSDAVPADDGLDIPASLRRAAP